MLRARVGADSQSIYYANPIDGDRTAGLWRTDVTTGDGETLINGIAKDAAAVCANAVSHS